MLAVAPVVCEVIVHRDLLPEAAREKVHGVFVARPGAGDGDGALFGVERPFGLRDFPARGAVEYLPPPLRIVLPVHGKLLGIVTGEERDGRRGLASNDRK